MTIKIKPTGGVPVPATPAQITTLQTDLGIQALINANTQLGAMAPAVQTLIDAAIAASTTSINAAIQFQLQNLSLNGLATNNGPLLPTNVGPVSVNGSPNTTLDLALNSIDLKAGAGGNPSPTAPVKSAAPTLAFPGGSGDVGEQATYTQGTYSSGTVTSRDLQIVVNGIVVQTLVGVTNGQVLTAIPASAGNGARSYSVVELANWAGGAPVANASIIYTINAAGVPIVQTVPAIVPATATELTQLVPTQGVYTVNGTVVANSTLTFTYRWTADWTLTGALVAATSANFTAVWGGTTGSYSVIFSDGSVKTTTLTNGSAAFSWTGAVTATSAAKVQLATTATLQLNTNNISHVMRYYETPTGAGGAGSEQQASNTVTPTSSTGGGGGTIEAGHRWLVSIPATGPNGPANWADYQAQRALFPVTSGRTSQNAEAKVAAIPTSYSVTLVAGSTAAQINSALAANNVVALAQGSYTINTMITVPANKTLIGLGTGAILNCATITGTPYGIKRYSNSSIINLTVAHTPGLGIWTFQNGCFAYKVSVQQAGFSDHSSIGWYGEPGLIDCVTVSCEAIQIQGGGEGDGFKLGSFGGGNNTYVDCHSFECDDDGFDHWSSSYSNFHHNCTSIRNGKNTSYTFTAGDGNGFKCGGPSGSTIPHYYNQCVAQDNGRVAAGGSGGCGISANGSASGIHHVLRLCTTTGNQNGNYYFSNTPDPNFYTIVNT